VTQKAVMENWSWPPHYDDSYRPPSDQEYWFPTRETMDPEEREQAILERIHQVMAHVYEKAPFYREKWQSAGLEPGDIRSLADFERVPVVTKEELRLEQAAHPPFGRYLCTPEPELVRIWGSSGTTGRPTVFGVGAGDWRAIANAHARIMWGMGIRPSDTVFVGSVFSLYIGSWGVLVGTERLGATAFPFGAGLAGQTRRAVQWMQEMKPTVFYGTPSYALCIAELAQEEGVDPRDIGLRIMFFSGEPGAAIPSIRGRIQDLYGAKVFDSGSMAEATPWMNLGESTAQAGMLCWQDIVYTEVVDPKTYRRVPYGSEGSPVYTHLERVSHPSIRVLSGDLTRWEAGPSPCGRTYPILPRGIYGRIDDQFTVRGENVQPSAIDEVVSALAGYGGEHRIVVSREKTMDHLEVQAEYVSTIAGDAQAIESFRRQAEAELRMKLGISTQVVPVPHHTFERTDFKASRVVDRRDLYAGSVETT
jgi:phenylacetate-CoA ligase